MQPSWMGDQLCNGSSASEEPPAGTGGPFLAPEAALERSCAQASVPSASNQWRPFLTGTGGCLAAHISLVSFQFRFHGLGLADPELLCRPRHSGSPLLPDPPEDQLDQGWQSHPCLNISRTSTIKDSTRSLPEQSRPGAIYLNEKLVSYMVSGTMISHRAFLRLVCLLATQ